ncbi:MAG: hypothetical protein ACK49N_03330 [Verrucomicrobiota bacterium]
MITYGSSDGVSTVVMENDLLEAEIAPSIGGRLIRLRHRANGREFLWCNPRLALQPCAPGTEYDPNFYGGMDEMLPTDIAETIDGIDCPDHGELWTLPLTAAVDGEVLTLNGRLPLFGLDYQRRLRLDQNRLVCDYRITNSTDRERRFMWKLHAALVVQPGDRIVCPAATARAADLAWSRLESTVPFEWPHAGGLDLSRVPDPDGSTEFLFLYDLAEGRVALAAEDGARIECRFDTTVFPCCWYFATHGAMDGAFTALLEPCTSMPLGVNEATVHGFCSRLQPGEALETTVIWTVEINKHQTQKYTI